MSVIHLWDPKKGIKLRGRHVYTFVNHTEEDTSLLPVAIKEIKN